MSEFSLRCSLPEPYPCVKYTELNRYDAHMLKSLLDLKLYSFCEYIFASVLLKDNYPELSDILDCISMSELKHLKLIGRVLTNSGMISLNDLSIKPGRKIRKQYSASPLSPLDVISRSLDGEKETLSNIKLVNSQIHNKEVAALLSRIASDDEHHAEILTHLGHRYSE